MTLYSLYILHHPDTSNVSKIFFGVRYICYWNISSCFFKKCAEGLCRKVSVPEPSEVLAFPQETPSHPLSSWTRALLPSIMCFVLIKRVMASPSFNLVPSYVISSGSFWAKSGFLQQCWGKELFKPEHCPCPFQHSSRLKFPGCSEMLPKHCSTLRCVAACGNSDGRVQGGHSRRQGNRRDKSHFKHESSFYSPRPTPCGGRRRRPGARARGRGAEPGW